MQVQSLQPALSSNMDFRIIRLHFSADALSFQQRRPRIFALCVDMNQPVRGCLSRSAPAPDAPQRARFDHLLILFSAFWLSAAQLELGAAAATSIIGNQVVAQLAVSLLSALDDPGIVSPAVVNHIVVALGALLVLKFHSGCNINEYDSLSASST
jgi:hypothetical protein